MFLFLHLQLVDPTGQIVLKVDWFVLSLLPVLHFFFDSVDVSFDLKLLNRVDLVDEVDQVALHLFMLVGRQFMQVLLVPLLPIELSLGPHHLGEVLNGPSPGSFVVFLYLLLVLHV